MQITGFETMRAINKNITSRDSSESAVYSAFNLVTSALKSFSTCIVSVRMVALSFFGLSGSVFSNNNANSKRQALNWH